MQNTSCPFYTSLLHHPQNNCPSLHAQSVVILDPPNSSIHACRPLLLNLLLLHYNPHATPSTSLILPSTKQACLCPSSTNTPLGSRISHYQGDKAQVPSLGVLEQHQVHAKEELEKSHSAPARLLARHRRWTLGSKEAGTRGVAPAAVARTRPARHTGSALAAILVEATCVRGHLGSGKVGLVGSGGTWEREGGGGRFRFP